MIKIVILVGMLSIGYVVPMYANDNELVSLSFDSLFPISPTKKVIDTCMHAWDDLAALQKERESDAYTALLMDAFLGKMVRLESAVHKMIILSKSELKVEDSFYLLSLFDRLEQSSAHISLHDEHRVLAHHLLHSAKQTVQALLTE